MELFPDKLSYELLIRILERRLSFRRAPADQKYYAELLIDLRLRDQEIKTFLNKWGGPNRAA